MIEGLRTAPLLSGLTDEQLERVSSHASVQSLDEGQWLFSQGDPARRFYLVRSGQMRLFRLSPDGGEKVIEIVSPGQTFAEALMFLNAPRYPVCAAALDSTELVCIDARDFAAMLRESVDTCFVVLGALSRRLRTLIGEIDNLTLHSAKTRVARWLLAHRPEGRSGLELEVRKAVLASRLSITPETLSRALRQMNQDGAISVRGARIEILDLDALTDLADFAGGELGSPERL